MALSPKEFPWVAVKMGVVSEEPEDYPPSSSLSRWGNQLALNFRVLSPHSRFLYSILLF